jgi:hypothetical protein
MSYRQLTEKEIRTLLGQGCQAEDWSAIQVKEDFTPDQVTGVKFSGWNKLGHFSGTIETEKGIMKPCGLSGSWISNCDIADNVYIADVKTLANYRIKDNVAIENVGSLVVSSETSFGNGTEIEVLNEGGGRELPIFDRLSAQMAYLLVMYRHDAELITRLNAMIRTYAESKKSTTGSIESGARIFHASSIVNVHVGPGAIIHGISLMEDGSVMSCPEAPVIIGDGVAAKKFIVLSGSEITGSAQIEKCFIGQGVKIGRQFSAENSAFFANCDGFHSEACSVFAGPYTVTHHKSTLLIAGLFSFFNAGSGTNQSNHMYKLGPLHQGILERGSKTGSFSYLLWPCRIGAYSVVVGKHFTNFNTADFPFSYITEDKGKSFLYPAMNLFTVGTRRDSEKWPIRDRRKDPKKTDLIHFSLFNPYIGGKIIRAIELLNSNAERASKSQEHVGINGILVPRLLLKATKKYYEMALLAYLGHELAKRIESISHETSYDKIRKRFSTERNRYTGEWIDISGMLAAKERITELISFVVSDPGLTVESLQDQLLKIYNSYEEDAWTWCAGQIERLSGEPIHLLSKEKLLRFIRDWEDNALKLNNMILKDAEREYDASSRIGFGIDGDEQVRNQDFEAVRGLYETNKFVLALRKESSDIKQRAAKITELVEKSA